jgi:protein phosphatase
MEVVGCSHPGRKRSANEDAYFADSSLALCLVADGMGGHLAGEVASRLAVETIADFVRCSQTDHEITWPYGLDAREMFEVNQLANAIQLAHQRIRFEGCRRADQAGMGSTIVAALVRHGRVFYASVGDSRLYRQRRGELCQLTVDDSLAAAMMRVGAAPDTAKDDGVRHLLTHALGSAEPLAVRVSQETVRPGDLLLLCTDGLHGVVGHEAMRHLLERDEPLTARASRLIEAANDAGGPDNVTAVIARVGDESAPGRTSRTFAGSREL